MADAREAINDLGGEGFLRALATHSSPNAAPAASRVCSRQGTPRRRPRRRRLRMTNDDSNGLARH